MRPTTRLPGEWRALSEILVHIRRQMKAHGLDKYFRMPAGELSTLVDELSHLTSLVECATWVGFVRGLTAALWHTRANGGTVMQPLVLACPCSSVRLRFRAVAGRVFIEPEVPRRASSFGRVDHAFESPTSPLPVLSRGTPPGSLSS